MSSRARQRSATSPTWVTSVSARAIPVQLGTAGAVPLEVAKIGNAVDEDVGPLGQGDQIAVHGGVTREHDRAVGRVETVRKRRNRAAVGHGDGGDPDNSVVENDDRNLGGGLGPFST
jgi:hypothetical protein